MLFLAATNRGPQLSKQEVMGMLCGFVGAAILVLDIRSDGQSTLFGDLLAAAGTIRLPARMLDGYGIKSRREMQVLPRLSSMSSPVGVCANGCHCFATHFVRFAL